MKKKIIVSVTIFILLILIFLFIKNLKTKEAIKIIETETTKETFYNSNIIENVYYSSKDAKGNEYIIEAVKGEIDYKNINIIFLTDVKALIRLTNTNDIRLTSDYGKYNSNNFDTIFSKNVIIDYLDNRLMADYSDFSIKRGSLIVSRNVIYKSLENILKADVVEIDINSKDTKIFMFDNNNKVNIKNR
jgi:hypothetical protein